MSCNRPLPAYKHRGLVKIGRAPSLLGVTEAMELPCGRCIGCKMDRSRMWSLRITHEAQLYDSNLFCTFTYDDEHLPRSLSLEYRDFQLFMKRLRKKCPGDMVLPDGRKAIRFFVAGEYGETYRRPHFHAILFNLRLPDMQPYVNETFSSNLLEKKLWQNGNVVIGTVTARSAAYCAGYTLNKAYGKDAQEHYEDVVNISTGEVSRRLPEFIHMSNDPGLGSWWYDLYKADLFPHDRAFQEGMEFKVPRFYWEKFKKEAPFGKVEEVEYERYLKSRAIPLEERTERRREVREEFYRQKHKLFFPRNH